MLVDIGNSDSIIVSRFGGIGDAVMQTPLLRNIKRKYPDKELIFITDPESKSIFENANFVDRIIGFDKSLSDTYRVWKETHVKSFWWLQDTTHRISMVAKFCGVNYRVGVPHKRGKYLTTFYNMQEWMNHAYEPYVYAKIFEYITGTDLTDIEDWAQLYYPEVSDMRKNCIDTILSKNSIRDYVVCSLHTSTVAKDWPVVKWLDLFEKLKQEGISVVLVGNDQDILDLPSNVFDLRRKTNLIELGYVIKKASLLVSGCSLPIHISNAMKTPFIGLCGTEPVDRIMHQYVYKAISANTDCGPCDPLVGSKGFCEQPHCMSYISVDSVEKSILDYMNGERIYEYKNSYIQKDWIKICEEWVKQ